MTRRPPSLLIATGLMAMLVMTGGAGSLSAQAPLAAAIDSLGAFDFPTRMAASRTIRRGPGEERSQLPSP